MKCQNKKIISELGQGMVEFALSFTIFALVVFSIIDFSWIGYQMISFDYAYKMSNWNISVPASDIKTNYSYDGETYNNLIRDQIVKVAAGLDKNKISASDTLIKVETETKNVKKPDGHPMVKRVQFMTVDSKIEYKIIPITPIGQSLFGKEILIKKTLQRKRLLRSEESVS